MVQVWCEWSRQWLPAAIRPDRRAVWWQEGPVSLGVEIRLTGDDTTRADQLRRWGYRTVRCEPCIT